MPAYFLRAIVSALSKIFCRAANGYCPLRAANAHTTYMVPFAGYTPITCTRGSDLRPHVDHIFANPLPTPPTSNIGACPRSPNGCTIPPDDRHQPQTKETGPMPDHPDTPITPTNPNPVDFGGEDPPTPHSVAPISNQVRFGTPTITQSPPSPGNSNSNKPDESDESSRSES